MSIVQNIIDNFKNTMYQLVWASVFINFLCQDRSPNAKLASVQVRQDSQTKQERALQAECHGKKGSSSKIRR